MHVAGAVASQRWDRLAQKRRLLREHMAIEECGLQGGRSSTCVAWRPGLATPPKTADVPQSGHWLLFFLVHTNEQTGQETLGPKIHKWAFREAWSLWDQGSPAKLVYLLLASICRVARWWFSVLGAEKGRSLLKWGEYSHNKGFHNCSQYGLITVQCLKSGGNDLITRKIINNCVNWLIV